MTAATDRMEIPRRLLAVAADLRDAARTIASTSDPEQIAAAMLIVDAAAYRLVGLLEQTEVKP